MLRIYGLLSKGVDKRQSIPNFHSDCSVLSPSKLRCPMKVSNFEGCWLELHSFPQAVDDILVLSQVIGLNYQLGDIHLNRMFIRSFS